MINTRDSTSFDIMYNYALQIHRLIPQHMVKINKYATAVFVEQSEDFGRINNFSQFKFSVFNWNGEGCGWDGQGVNVICVGNECLHETGC